MRWRGITVTGVVIASCLVALGLTSDVLVDLVWFSAVGYVDVFWTVFGTKVILFFAVFIGSTIFIWVNGTLALRLARRQGPWLPLVIDRESATMRTVPERLPKLLALASVRLPRRLLIAGVAIVLGILIAVVETGNWL